MSLLPCTEENLGDPDIVGKYEGHDGIDYGWDKESFGILDVVADIFFEDDLYNVVFSCKNNKCQIMRSNTDISEQNGIDLPIMKFIIKSKEEYEIHARFYKHE